MLCVCGITYDHTVNYGSCLQAYALQEIIENISFGGEKNKYLLIPVRTFREWPVNKSLKGLIVLPIILLHRTQFRSFENKYMHFAKVCSFEDLSSLNKFADAFVCGSDVIWNPDLNFNLPAFYLDFANKYKFSYAASFGKAEIDDTTLNSVKSLVDSFDSISLREESGLNIISSLTNKPARVVCDPVLLMTKNAWENLIIENRRKQKYIFVYITHLSKNVQNYLLRLKEETGLEIVYAAYGPKQAIKFGMIQVQKPERWLQLLHDAEYVVTNSFHATAFSVLFHKKFFTVVNGDISKGINVRMYDLLNYFGLKDRIFSSVPMKIDLSEIDYNDVDKKLSGMREDSLNYLRENLEAAYQQKLELEKAT